MELVEELEKGVAISHFSVADKCDLLNDDLLSLTSSDPELLEVMPHASNRLVSV